MPKVRLKPVEYQAEQWRKDMPKESYPEGVRWHHILNCWVLHIQGEPLRLTDGDWVLTASNGDKWLYRDEEFKQHLEIVDNTEE